MTRKDYEKLAAAFKATRPIMPPDSDKGRQWKRDLAAIADALAEDNSAFARGRFYAACEAAGDWTPEPRTTRTGGAK